MAVMMLAVFAVPLALAENTEDADTADTDVAEAGDADANLISPASEATDATVAQEATDDMNEEAGAGAIAMNRIKNWFTFRQEKKVELDIKLAKLRLIQARVAAKNGNIEAMEKAMAAHDKIIARAQKRIESIDGAATEEGAKETADKLVGLERAIQVHEARIAKLQNLLANANLTDAQKAKIEAKIAHAQEVTDKLKGLNEAKQDKIKTKLMAVGGMTEEEADAVIAEKRATIRERIKAKVSGQA